MEKFILNTRLQSYFYFFGLLFFIAFIERFVASQPAFFDANGYVFYAIHFDLLIIIPLLYYFLIIQRLHQHWTYLFFGISSALSVSYWVLPSTHLQILKYAEKIIILFEVAIFVFILLKIKKVKTEYQFLQSKEDDFIKNVITAFSNQVGNSPLILFLVSELIMLRYALFFWWKTKKRRYTQSFFDT